MGKSRYWLILFVDTLQHNGIMSFQGALDYFFIVNYIPRDKRKQVGSFL
jgi:hypothetical protein